MIKLKKEKNISYPTVLIELWGMHVMSFLGARDFSSRFYIAYPANEKALGSDYLKHSVGVECKLSPRGEEIFILPPGERDEINITT